MQIQVDIHGINHQTKNSCLKDRCVYTVKRGASTPPTGGEGIVVRFARSGIYPGGFTPGLPALTPVEDTKLCNEFVVFCPDLTRNRDGKQASKQCGADIGEGP